jgi:hypothetical protein
MPKTLFLYFVTALFIAWTLSAPLLARYGSWLQRGNARWTQQDEEDMAVRFRVMGAIGSLMAIAFSVLATIGAIRA